MNAGPARNLVIVALGILPLCDSGAQPPAAIATIPNREMQSPSNEPEVDISMRAVFDRAPVAVRLPVGHERQVSFPEAVRVGLPATIEPHLRTQSANGTVYWLARKAFAPARVQVAGLSSGTVYLLDVSAETGNQAPREPLEITPKTMPANPETQVDESDSPPPQREGLGYVELTRYAAHQVYAPTRLLPDSASVYRVPVATDPVLLVRGQRVKAQPLAAWRSGGLYVTAVRLANLHTQPVLLDPRQLRGRWLTATFQHAYLQRRGSDADTTAVYLIAKQPWEASW